MKRPLVLVFALRLHEGATRHPGGNFSWVRNLLASWLPRAEAAGLSCKVMVDDLGARDLSDVIPQSSMLHAGRSGESVLRTDMRVHAAVRNLRPDLYFRPAGQLPLGWLDCPSVIGIGDLNFRWLNTSWPKRLYKELSYRWSVRRADAITCISDFTRRDLIAKFRIAPGKVSVVHLAATPLPEPQGMEIAEGPFWLTFGHQMHKNVELCLRALATDKAMLAAHRLVVVGRCDHTETVLKPLTRALGLERRVSFVGKVSPANLCWLYRRAVGLLFVSKFEGFGLPVLEAMAIGCPVISSDVCSLPEIVGDAGILVGVDDLAALIAAMRQLSSERDFRMRMIAHGYQQAGRFSWERTARATLEVIHEVLARRGSDDTFSVST